MANKPPAFQFYAKDWRSSPTVKRMTLAQRGLYIDLMALAWDSEEPGTINMSIEQISRELRVYSRTLLRLLAEFPATWRRVGEKLVQPKLELQWYKYQEISAKRSASAKQMHCSASAPAFAVASASAKPKTIGAKSAPFVVPEWVPQAAWKGYEEMRRLIKKPMTNGARNSALGRLKKLAAEGHTPTAVLEQSIFNSWQGLFPIGGNRGRQQEDPDERLRQAARNIGYDPKMAH